MTPQALDGLRIVECGSGVSASYAARLLADLGADVLKVEDRRGDVTRRQGPHPPDFPDDPDRSGLFAALNAGKRCVSIDIETDEGLAGLFEHLRTADVFVTNQSFAARRRLGLTGEMLGVTLPSLIVASVTPFAEASTLRDVPGTSLHSCGLSGLSNAIGDPTREPLPLPYDSGDYIGGANAAAAILLAVVSRSRGVDVGHLNVSVADVLFSFAATCSMIFEEAGQELLRAGRRAPGSGGSFPFEVLPCKDGYVMASARTQDDWVTLLGMMGNPAWSREDRFRVAREVALHHADEADELLEEWFATRTKQQLFDASRAAGFPLAPVLSVSEVLEGEQLAHRDSLSDPIPVGDESVRFVRGPYQLSATPVPRSPTVGPAWSASVRSPAAAPSGRGADHVEPDHAPLSGLRVLDLSWVWSGPMVSAVLSDFGADVVKVEHAGRLDNSRLRGRPIRDGKPIEGPQQELSRYFHQNNRGKSSLSLDIKHPDGAAVFRRLAAVADVVIENLTPGVFERAGLGYEQLAPMNEGLVWLSMKAMGGTGPLSSLRAYAPTMTSLAGLESLVGYTDDPVMGTLTAGIGDPNAGSHALVGLLAALVARERTGRGQFIDMSQVEATISVLCEPICCWQLTGHLAPVLGTRHTFYSPHGYYPCRGDDQWIAIAALDDEMWARLADATGIAALADDAGRWDRTERRSRADEIDKLLAAWTVTRDRDVAWSLLAERGIASAPVLAAREALDHEAFADVVRSVSHPFSGREDLLATPWHVSKTPATIRATAPLLGAHTADVLGRWLGMPQTEVDPLIANGALR